MGKYATITDVQVYLETQDIGGPTGNFQKPSLDTDKVNAWIEYWEARADSYLRQICPKLDFTAESIVLIRQWVVYNVVGDSRLGTFFTVELSSAIKEKQMVWRDEADRLFKTTIKSGNGIQCSGGVDPANPGFIPSSVGAYRAPITPNATYTYGNRPRHYRDRY